MGPAPEAAFVLAIPLRGPSINRPAVEIETRRTMLFFFAPSSPEEHRGIALQTRWIDEYTLGIDSAGSYSGLLQCNLGWLREPVS